MRVFEVRRRSAVAVPSDATLRQAAALMEASGLGSLAVLDGDELVGIVTDRDLVRRGMARGMPDDARVDAVMSAPVITVDADADVREAMELFRANAVRRLAVLEDGRLRGVLSLDDLLVELAHQFDLLIHPVLAEIVTPHHESSLPVA